MVVPSLQDVGLAVKRLQWRHHRLLNSGLTEVGLSLAQWDVLRHLHAHPDASLHDLARLTFQTDQSMGALAGRMIGRELIERVAGPGRSVRHRITPAGDAARRAGADVVDAVLRDTLGGLTGDERTTLHRLLVRAAEPPSRRTGDPGPTHRDEQLNRPPASVSGAPGGDAPHCSI